MPSATLLLPTLQRSLSLHRGSSSHRLKHMDNSDRRVCCSQIMNMYSHCNKLVYCDANHTDGGVSHEPSECETRSVSKVAEAFSKSLQIEIPEDSTDAEDSMVDEAEKVLPIYVSSSSPGSTSVSEEWSDEGCNEECSALNSLGSSKAIDSAPEATSINLPSPSTVVSAMKGSREKQGMACSKLSVSWSPDVYDPVPTIVSHTVKNKQKRHSKSDKKSGKGNHKGNKAYKQSAGKDRRQTHKSSGNGKNCHASLDAHDRTLSFDNQSVNFDVGSPEFFASSFLKSSLMKVQMPATEAL